MPDAASQISGSAKRPVIILSFIDLCGTDHPYGDRSGKNSRYIGVKHQPVKTDKRTSEASAYSRR